MTWTSDYGAQRACLKGLDASGLKGLEPNYYSVLFCPGIAILWLSKMSQCLVCVGCELRSDSLEDGYRHLVGTSLTTKAIE
jgi:hypothetical protein